MHREHTESWIQGYYDAYLSDGWNPEYWDSVEYEAGWESAMKQLVY